MVATTFEQREQNLINSLLMFSQENNISIRTPENIKEEFSISEDDFGEYPIYIIQDILNHCVKSQLNFVLFEKPQNFRNCTILNDAGNLYIQFNNINPEINPDEYEFFIFPGFEYFSYEHTNKTLQKWEDTLFDFLNNIFF